MCDPTPTGRKETADQIAKENDGVIIHPYDNYDVMAGQVLPYKNTKFPIFFFI